MGTCMVFNWARAVLSPQFLSLVPSSINCESLLSDVTNGLNVTADLTSDRSCPALQGKWEDIILAQIKLIKLLRKWKADKNSNKLVTHSNTNNINSYNNDSNNKICIDEDVPRVLENGSSDNNHYLITTTIASEIKQKNVQNDLDIVAKTDSLINSKPLTEDARINTNIRNVYLISNEFKIPSLTCAIPSLKDKTVPTLEGTGDDQMSMTVNNSQVILLTTSPTVDHKTKSVGAQNSKKEEELYMNIVLASTKDYNSSLKDLPGKNVDCFKSASRENPLDKLCQLLRIDEEEPSVNETVNKVTEEFERRRRYEENMPYKYFCSYCSFKTKRENQLVKHLKLHEKHRVIYHCNRCQFSTIRVSMLRRHELQHNEGRLVSCSKCPYKTDSLRFLRRHIQAKHSSRKPVLRCGHCDFDAGTLRELKRHRLIHSPDKPKIFFSCNLCSYKTQNKGHLQRHKNDVHELIRPYLCHHCGKSFKRHDTLKTHKMIHGEAGPTYSCSQCNKICRSSTQLKEHMTVHTTQRPFLCELCGATFKTRSNQYKHIKLMHTSVKFTCSLCKKAFNSKPAMMRHQKTHADKENNTETKCIETTKTYMTSNSQPISSDLVTENVVKQVP